MANFDALRPAVLGPLAFMAREIVKPAALLACFPFTTNILDVSKYGKIFAPSATPTFVEGGPFGSYASIRGSFSHELAGQWSIDFYANFGVGSGNGYIQPSSSTNFGIQGASSGKALCQIAPANYDFAPASTGAWTHFAITYDGTTFKGYTNGNISFSATATLKSQTSVTIGYGSSITKLCNLRVVGKVLGNGTTYPVPSTLYTGYEAI